MSKAYILSIGNEVTSGHVINTNAAYIASKLDNIGIKVEKVLSILDDEEAIKSCLSEFQKSDAQILISTGGLGPTHDDITKEVFAKFLGLNLEENEISKKDMHSYFGKDMNDSNYKQVLQPVGAVVVPNHLGSADGYMITKDGKVYISLVGPSFEMQPMLDGFVLPKLVEFGEERIVYQFMVYDKSESSIQNEISDLVRQYKNVGFAPYANTGYIRYELSSTKEFENELSELKDKFKRIVYSNLVSENGSTVEEEVVKLLKKKGLKVSFAESMTGGLLASIITSISGASEVIDESYVTYSNGAKNKLLGVSLDTIDEFDVVSLEVVHEMAKGLKERTESDVCVAISGYAGPSGKDVGKVCYAISYKDKVASNTFHFKGTREMIRLRSARTILFNVFRMLKDER